jgi:ribosomal protein S20
MHVLCICLEYCSGFSLNSFDIIITISTDERKRKHKECEVSQKEAENGVMSNMKDVVKKIFEQLQTHEKDEIQKNYSFKGTEGQSLVDRFVARAKTEGNSFRFLMNVLREIGRIDLVQDLTERVERHGTV